MIARDALVAAVAEIAACEPTPGPDAVDHDRQLDACIDRIHQLARDLLDRLEEPPVPGRRYLVVRFDVTDLPEHEVDALEGEVSVQAEHSSDYEEWDGVGPAHPQMGHRSVPYPTTEREVHA